MLASRIFNIVRVSFGHGTGLSNTPVANHVINYTSRAVKVSYP